MEIYAGWNLITVAYMLGLVFFKGVELEIDSGM